MTTYNEVDQNEELSGTVLGWHLYNKSVFQVSVHPELPLSAVIGLLL